jgi:hypothetical protein
MTIMKGEGMNLIKPSAIVVLTALVAGLVGAKIANGQDKVTASTDHGSSAQLRVLQARLDTLQAQQAADMQLHREQVSAALREPNADGTTAAPAAAASAAPLTPEAQDALQRANDLVDQAIANGTWGPDQVQQFRDDAHMIPVSQKMDVMRKLVVAINNKTVHVTAHGFPF